MKLSIAIPCYKSEQTIGKVVDEICQTMKKHNESSFEIVLVNDASPDNTMSVLKDIALHNEHVIAIDLSKNFGQFSAIMCAYAHTSGDYIISMDDDGEHNPEDIYKLVDKLEEGYDYVCAQFDVVHHKWYKVMGSKFNYWFLSKMMDLPKGANTSSFNIMRRYVLEQLLHYNNPHPYIGGMIWSITNHIGFVKIDHKERYAGESGYNFKKLFALWLNGVTTYSIKPLRIASFTGFGFAFIGLILVVITVINYFLKPNDPKGYASTFAMLCLVGGLIMAFLGIIGEYIGRISLIANKMPQYVVREVIQKKEND